MAVCPSAATLARWGIDTLDGFTFAAVEEHIERCEDCRARLERLDRNGKELGGSATTLPASGQPPRIPGFVIEQEVGRGGMGVVYRALQPSLDRQVALKVVRSGSAAGPADHTRWLREARASARVRHNNVLRLHDVGEIDGWLYLVLEFIPGGTLKRRLDGPLPPRVAAEIVETIARAVHAIHGHRLLHLDLKPSNILLDGEPDAPWDRAVPKISDFGLAIGQGDPGVSSASLAGPRGTPSYMAPEQAADTPGRVGPAADIHALGAILYELLTGRPPFQGATVIETLDQVRDQEPVPPRRLNPKVPRDLETIALKCLEKDPSRRYPSAEAVADDLRRWLEDRPITARPVTALEKLWRWCRRRPVAAGLSATSFLLLSACLLGLLVLWRKGEVHRQRAESQWLRAESNYRMTRKTLSQVLDLGENATRSNRLSRDQVIATLKDTRGRVLELAKAVPGDPGIPRLLASADLYLALNLEMDQKFDEAYLICVESLGCWENELRRDPLEKSVRFHQWETLNMAARITEQLGKAREIIDRWERAVIAGEEAIQMTGILDPAAVARCRVEFARALGRGGQWERAVIVGEETLRLASTVDSFTHLRCRAEFASILAEAGQWERAAAVAEETLRLAGILDRSMVLGCRADFAHALAHAGQVDRARGILVANLSMLGETQSKETGRTMSLDAVRTWQGFGEIASLADAGTGDDWLREFDSLFDSTRSDDASRQGHKAEAAYGWVRGAEATAAYQRRTKRLEQARQTADRIYVFAARLVERFPGQAFAHMALGEAYSQFTKNAWKPLDRTAIVRNLRLSVDEVRRALALEPENEFARKALAVRQGRLEQLLRDALN